MKRFKKGLLVLLTVLLISSTFYSVGLPQENKGDWSRATREEFNMADLLLARPLGFVAGIIGLGIYIVTLPFTVPTNSAHEAAQMLVEEPFRFAFDRKFPDEEIAARAVPSMED